MFWVRPHALDPLLNLDDEDFEIEEGYTDGCTPHAVERMFGVCVEFNNFKIVKLKSDIIYS